MALSTNCGPGDLSLVRLVGSGCRGSSSDRFLGSELACPEPLQTVLRTEESPWELSPVRCVEIAGVESGPRGLGSDRLFGSELACLGPVQTVLRTEESR